MDVGNDILLRDGVAYPANLEVHQEMIEYQAVRTLRNQLGNVIRGLHEPTRPVVEAVVRFRIMAIQSVCDRALMHMTDFIHFNAMADVAWAEVQEQLVEEPEDDPEEDPEVDGEGPEEQDVDKEEAPGGEEFTSDSDCDPE